MQFKSWFGVVDIRKSQQRQLGLDPNSVWLPALAYRPWSRYLSFMSLSLPHVLSVSHGLCLSLALLAVEFCEISSSSEGCSCESLTAAPTFCWILGRPSHLRLICSFPTFADCFEAPPTHLRCIDFCWMLRGFSSSLAAVFTRSLLLLLGARLCLHALSSQARHWLEVPSCSGPWRFHRWTAPE